RTSGAGAGRGPTCSSARDEYGPPGVGNRRAGNCRPLLPPRGGFRMTAAYGSETGPQRPAVDAVRLWTGGAATALVAALITVVGVLLVRGIFGVPVLAPKGKGVWGDASTAWYALGAAGAAIVATGLMHILLLYTPRPM